MKAKNILGGKGDLVEITELWAMLGLQLLGHGNRREWADRNKLPIAATVALGRGETVFFKRADALRFVKSPKAKRLQAQSKGMFRASARKKVQAESAAGAAVQTGEKFLDDVVMPNELPEVDPRQMELELAQATPEVQREPLLTDVQGAAVELREIRTVLEGMLLELRKLVDIWEK